MIPSKLTITGEECHKKGLQALRNGNDKKAFDCFSQGYGKFYGPCLTELGKMYRNGRYVERSPDKAMYFFKRGAYNYDEQSCNFLVGELYCCENQQRLTAEQAKILKYIDSVNSRREKSEFIEQWLIGEMYRLGLGHKKNFDRALNWYSRAIEARPLLNLEAEDPSTNPKKLPYEKVYLSIGYVYEHGGNGEERNYHLALNFYRKAADNNCAEACNNLGNFYKNGFGVPVNYNEAFRWYFKAATCNHLEIEPCTSAQFNLGIMYQNGWGTKVDNDSAMFWFKKATYGGNKEAGDYVEQIHRNNMLESRKIILQSGGNDKHLLLLSGTPENHEARLSELEKQLRVTEEKIEILLTQFDKLDPIQVVQKKQVECNK